MSLFTDASLVMIPSGVKDGKLYSIKPDDGVGDFTFTRGSNLAATRVDENGLIEKGRENLLLQSNQFDTTWTNSNSSETSGQSGYDGSSDAWLITKNDAFGFIKQAISSSGTQTFSVYAKASDSDWIRLYVNGVGSLVYFDLSTGVVGGASSVIDSNIDSIGNGWYRCSIAFSGNTTEVYIYPAEENSVSATSGSVYIQDAQLELGLVATDYIETGATTEQAGILENLPRLDYTDSSCPSLLLEPTRSNLVTQSEYFPDSSWSNKVNISIDGDQYISPDGGLNSFIIRETAVFGEHRIAKINTFNGNNEYYSFSVFAKAGGARLLNLFSITSSAFGAYAVFDLVNGTATATTGTATIESYGNGFYRCVVTGVSASSGSSIIGFRHLNSSSSEAFFGDVNQFTYLYGAQLELGSYPTSYIPTYGTSVTRSRDLCFGAGDATTFNDNEGVLFVEVAHLYPTEIGTGISVNNGSISNRITIGKNSAFSSIVSSLTSSGTQDSLTGGNYVKNEFIKIAVKYKSGDNALWVNGVEVDTSTFASMPLSLNNLSFDVGSTGLAPFLGRVKNVIYFPTALTDSELAALTTI